MESKEILREFAGKLAGLSAAAKVVAIAGAVSTMNGTLFAAGESAAEEKLRVIEPANQKRSDTVSDLATRKEEPVKEQGSEAVVNTLLASKEKGTAKGKTMEFKPVVTPKNQVKPVVASRIQVKGNIAPKIQERVAIYESKEVKPVVAEVTGSEANISMLKTAGSNQVVIKTRDLNGNRERQ